MQSRRELVLGASALTLAGLLAKRGANADVLMDGLSDPALQPKFTQIVPNAADPAFFTRPFAGAGYQMQVGQARQFTGLVGANGSPVGTTIWGFGQPGRAPSWPGYSFNVRANQPIAVRWENKLSAGATPLPHLLPVDRSFHYAYSLAGYQQFDIAKDGVPFVPHLHGGRSTAIFDGFPEAFFTPDFKIKGPAWRGPTYTYDNRPPAGTLWYHDHTLGLTRLNVYAGLAGFYFLRDAFDTGLASNPLGLPAFPYELAYAIQDRMFRANGELFYPGLPGDPFWADYITGQGLADDAVPQPSGLAEFFGDHMVVNGKIWPKADVEPRPYRLRLLNGCDSRFLVVQFRAVGLSATTLDAAGAPIPFHVIGSDQGFATAATQTDTLIMGPGERYDVIVDFAAAGAGRRVIAANVGGDAPFGGAFGDELVEGELFPNRQTDRIMAFDVTRPLASPYRPFDPTVIRGFYAGNTRRVDRVRKVALVEGTDEFGRIQPMLGVAEPTVNARGQTVNGALTWHEPTTENPRVGATEVWEIYNATVDAHPVHLHLVNFEILNREDYTAMLIDQPITLHNGTTGLGSRLEGVVLSGAPVAASGVEKAPKDMVTALPGQVTRIKATFDRPGRYVWHCHILSHEDHDMMRVMHVGPGAT